MITPRPDTPPSSAHTTPATAGRAATAATAATPEGQASTAPGAPGAVTAATTAPAPATASTAGVAGAPTSRTADHDRPDPGNVAARVGAAFLVLTSVVLFVLGVGRWLTLVGTGAAPPAARWSADLAPAYTHGGRLLAAPGDTPGTNITLEQFLTNVQWFLFGVLGTLTITFFLVGFTRCIAAGADSEEYEKGKKALKSALYGFLGAMLSPAIVSVLGSLFQGRR